MLPFRLMAAGSAIEGRPDNAWGWPPLPLLTLSGPRRDFVYRDAWSLGTL